MNDELFFAEEEIEVEEKEERANWKILVVDDEEEIHSVTKMVLSNLKFDNVGIDIISAYSGEEAKKKLKEIDGIALAFLDVVMETEHSGLDLVKYIREELKNDIIRIILRTGQPGQAPEREVIKNYEINDYKEKSELTSKKLYTSVITALRSYQNINTINKSKRGLENIIKASGSLFTIESVKKLANGILTQLTSILKIEDGILYMEIKGLSTGEEEKKVITGTGKYENYSTENIKEILGKDIYKGIKNGNASIYKGNEYVGVFKTKKGLETMLYLKGIKSVNEMDKYLIDVFSSNISIALDNIFLLKDRGIREKKLSEANKIKEEFLSNISHELRTPLNGITGIIDLLSMTKLNEEQEEFLEMAKVSSERLENIINTIIKFITVVAENEMKEKFNIKEKLEQTKKIYREKCNKKNIEFIFEIDEDLQEILIGDIYNILEIINKLLENAVKFTKKGQVKIVIKKKEELDNEINLQIIVSDTGIGILESKKARVFENFFQGEHFMTKEYEGIGMGLALVKKILEKLNGKIEFESEEGKGSTFLVELPLELEK